MLTFPITLFSGASSFPIVDATNTSNTSSATTSHTVNLPAGIVAGNLLIIVFGNFTAASTVTITGYTQLVTQTNTNGRLTVLYKTATGSEGSTVSATTSGAGTISAHNSYRISGWSGTPEAATTSGTDANPNPPSLTPSWTTTKTLWIAATNADRVGASLTVSAFPSGYSGGIQNTGTLPVQPATCTGSAWVNSQAASEDPGTFSLSNSVSWSSATIGIQPA